VAVAVSRVTAGFGEYPPRRKARAGTEWPGLTATSALSRRIYVTATRSLCDVDATVAFVGVNERGMSVQPVTRARRSAWVLLGERAKPMKDPDLIAAGITMILALVIALALRAAGIILEAPVR
jgi:hypothetical protein